MSRRGDRGRCVKAGRKKKKKIQAWRKVVEDRRCDFLTHSAVFSRLHSAAVIC